MTFVGNFTLLAAAWWIWRSSQSADTEQIGVDKSDRISTALGNQSDDF
jgi:hypothetical protein